MLLKRELGVTENSYYEASVHRPDITPPLSGETSADVCIIGAGYTGLSAALELSQRGYSVVVLEAQRIGWGASGRNGGQAIVGFGSDGECAIEKQFNKEDARRAWDTSIEGINLIKKRIQDFNIDCEYTAGFLNVAISKKKSDALKKWMAHIDGNYDHPMEWIPPEEIEQWLKSPRYHSGAYDATSGHLHPLKYCLGLAEAAKKTGVSVHENSAAFHIQRGKNPIVKTALGSVSCKFVVLAGNVYLGEYGDEIAPEIRARIMPVGTYIIATEPMGNEIAQTLMPKRPAVSDNNFVLDYFRLSEDNRLLFGAGDNYRASKPRNIAERIRSRMLDVFPQLEELAIPYAWGGFVDITMNRSPHFGRLQDNIYYLQGFSGHGVAMTGMAGRLVAEAIAGQAERFDLFARLKHAPFPGGEFLRTPALVLGMWFYRLRDLL
jgi:gamma-glutamylputrescine oxidase